MSSLTIIAKLDRSKPEDQLVKDSSLKQNQAREIEHLFRRINNGTEHAEIDVSYDSEDPTAASEDLTISSISATDTVTIGGVTFTANGSPSTNVQFDSSGTDAEAATSLATKINDHPTLGEVVSASASSATVTVTCKIKGRIGNFIELSDSGGSVSAGGTELSGGTGGAVASAATFSYGL